MASIKRWLKRARGDNALRHTETRIMKALERQNVQLAEILTRLTRLEKPVAINPETWSKIAQPGELAFHKRPNLRTSAEWQSKNTKFWAARKFSQEGWEGKWIVDVGAGSRLRTLYFQGAKIAAIEPLADKFIAEVEWQDLDQADEVYAVPAEKDIPELHGRADLLVSVNVLDHGYDFEATITNVRHYLKPDGLAYLTFDQHERPDDMHQLMIDDTKARAIFDRCGLDLERYEEWGRYHGAAGPPALHYWLRPRD
ncbi:MAG TPA: methyltransferase domain-containing protein [Micromonosporaceae bacterium]|jgi:2-polyprenyl-3-methyl-5-hydroxy-6-metoxy-1,4-benzoquinol methylase